MDPSTINRLGQVRHQEIVEWATRENGQVVVVVRPWAVLLRRVAAFVGRVAPSGRMTESADCERSGFDLG